jgi:oxygen-dependent protoporphyrinogen oxidase
VVVVGGGIAGLAAAHRIRRDAPPGTTITVVEQSGLIGGKLRTAEAGGIAVETAAEAFLVRRPEALDLARELGLDLLNPPSTAGCDRCRRAPSWAFPGRRTGWPPSCRRSPWRGRRPNRTCPASRSART